MNIERQTAFDNNKNFVKAGESDHSNRKSRVFRFEFRCTGDPVRDRKAMMEVFKRNVDAYFRFANR